MAKSQLDVLKEEFQNECKVINLKYEYEGYIGVEQWAIISALTEKELFEKYPDIISRYIPFVLLSVEQGKAVYEFRRNESKFYKRSLNNEDAFGYDDELIGIFHSEVFVPDFFEQQITEEYEENRYQLKMKRWTRLSQPLPKSNTNTSYLGMLQIKAQGKLPKRRVYLIRRLKSI